MSPEGDRGFVSKINNNPFWFSICAIATILGLIFAVMQVVSLGGRKLNPEVRDVKVVRTCGSKPGGNCGLTERIRPSRDAPRRIKDDHPQGTTLTVVCQVQGSSVKASELQQATTVWSKTKQGGYVSNAYLEGINVYEVTDPCPQ